MVHLDGLDFSGQLARSEGNDHTGLDDTSLNSADGHCTNTADLVDILKGQTESLVSRAGRWDDSVQSFKQSLAYKINSRLIKTILDCIIKIKFTIGFAFFALNSPSLVPGEVAGSLNHVVSVETRDGDEGNSDGVVTNLLDVAADFLLDFLITGLAERWLSGIHLVNTNNQLLDSQCVSQESVLAGLSVLGDTGFEFTDTTSNNQDGAISLNIQWKINTG